MLEKLTGRIEPGDSLDIYSLIHSEEVREYYRNKVELSAEQKESIITCCYQSLHKKWKLLQMLAVQQEGEEQRKVEESGRKPWNVIRRIRCMSICLLNMVAE